MNKIISKYSLHLQSWFLKNETKKCLIVFRNYFFIILASFIAASMLNTFISTLLLPSNSLSRFFQGIKPDLTSVLPVNDNSYFNQVKKIILERNIFNVTGEIPLEDRDEAESDKINFENIPCTYNTKIPVELLGIVYTGNPDKNLVIFKDSHVETADIYKEGQPIIDNNEYVISKITGPSSVQIRFGKAKICLSLDDNSNADLSKSNEGPHVTQNEEESYVLNADFVSSQIGEGYAKILSSARLVPETLDGKTIGFRISAITKDSIFDNLKLQNGDIVTGVNGTSLEDASQGFKLYEAFQNEGSIILKVLRQGKEITKKVTIR